jgi:ribonuclease Z
MSFTVTILGSGAAVPKLSRGTTAQYVSCHNRQILLDCGEGTQLQFRKFKLKFQSLDIILITHLHGDHVFGLPGLISTMGLLGRTKKLKIIGPTGIKKLITAQLDIVGMNKSFELIFTEIEKESAVQIYDDKCIEIHTFPLNHRIETQGYLINEKPHKRKLIPEKFEEYGVSVSYIQKLIQGRDITDNNGVFVRSDDVTVPGKASKSYAYCTDTAYDEKIIPHIQNADVLYHEATFLEADADRASKTYHSTAKQAASIAFKAGVKRLVLGHFSARYKDLNVFKEEAETIFEPTFIPNDGDIFYI